MGYDEDVLCVSSDLCGNWTDSEFTPLADHSDMLTEVTKHGVFINRGKAENDFSYRQVIPYVAFRCGKQWLLTQRTSKQTEKRLHNMYSIGLGGHINPDEEAVDSDIVQAGMWRELDEELFLDKANIAEVTFHGLISDNSNEVSRVHLGFFYVISVKKPDVKIKECNKMTADWDSFENIKNLKNKLEAWSQVAVKHLAAIGEN